jgi:hypothetical protein
MRRALSAGLLCLWLSGTVEARDRKIVVAWSELAAQVNGKRFSTVLKDGSCVEGRAISVEPESLAVKISKSSSAVHVRGKGSLPRASLSSIQVRRSGWKWKAILPFVGAAGIGAVGGMVGAMRGSLEGAAVGIVSGMGVGAAVGVLGGWSADHYYVTVDIAP